MCIKKEKCKCCEGLYDKYLIDKSLLIINCCHEYDEINELKMLLKKYSDEQHIVCTNFFENKTTNDNQLLFKDDVQRLSNSYEISFKVEGRTKYIDTILDKLIHIREILDINVGGYFEILDSIYEKKHTFWNETGNFCIYVRDAAIDYIILKLKECLSGSNSKYSIKKIKNEIINNQNRIYNEQKVYRIYTCENSNIIKHKYTSFPISEYVNIIDKTLYKYSKITDAIDKVRDKKIAHIDEKNVDNEIIRNLSYTNLKKIYNMVKLIYEGFIYSIAPDKGTTFKVDRNIWLDHLEFIVKEFVKKTKNNNNTASHQ